MAQAGTVWVDVRGDTTGFMKDVADGAQKASKSLGSSFGSGASTVLGDIGRVAGVAAVGVAGIGAAAINASMDFNAAMSGVSAVAGASASEMEALREAALKAGADTSFSASEAAAAQGELVKAGVSVSETLGGALTGALGLAAAGQLELADAAEISAQAMNIFDLAGEDVTHIADVLAAGANKSAADVKQLGDALRQGGLVASQLGIGLEDTVGTLSLFADNALVGSDAGTSFKTMLQRFVPSSEAAANAMAEMGLEFFDAEGNFVGLEEAAGRMQDAFGDMTQEQRAATMNTIFGADAIRAANLLYEAGAEGVAEYTAAVNDQGAATRMAAEQLNNLKGDLEEFSGATETALIRMGDLFDSTLRNVVQGASGFVDVFNDFATTPAWGAIQDNMDRLSELGGARFDALADGLRDVLDTISPADVDRTFAQIEGTFNRFSNAAEGLEPVLAGVSVALSSMALSSIPLIGGLIPAISPITGVLGGLVLGSEAGRSALEGLGKQAGEIANKRGPELLRALSGLAGELSDGLALAMEDVGGALLDAGDELLPVFADAIEELGPPLGDLIESLGELAADVLPDLADLIGVALPPMIDIFGTGLGLAADAAGLLADNTWLLVPALGAVVAVKFGDQIAGWGSKLSGVASQAATAAGDFGTYFKVLREEGATIGGSFKGAGNEVGGLAGSLTGMLNPAILGVTAAVTVGAGVYEAWASAKRDAEKVTRDLADALLDEENMLDVTLNALRANVGRLGIEDAAARAGISLRQMADDLRAAPGEIDKFREQINKSGSDQWLDFGNTFEENWRQIEASARQAGINIPQSIYQIRDAVREGLISEDEGLELINAMVDADKATELAADNIVTRFADIKDAAEDLDIDITPFVEDFEAASKAGDFEGQKAAIDALKHAYPELATAAGLAIGEVTSANSTLASETARAVGELRGLADEFGKLAGAELDADEANRRYLESLDRLTKSFVDNGAGVDVTTEAGRKNADAIKAAVEQAQRLAEAQALLDTTGKTSTDTLNSMAFQLGALRDAGKLTEEEYKRLIDLYGLTPEVIATTVVADTTDAKAQMDELQADFDKKKEHIEEPMEAWIQALIDQGMYAEAQAALNGLARDRQVKITPYVGAVTGLFGADSWMLPRVDGKRASGGPVWPGTFLVGEEGPELLHMAGYGNVTPAGPTQQILDGKTQSGGEFGAADVDRLVSEVRALSDSLAMLATRPQQAPVVDVHAAHGIDISARTRARSAR